MLRFAVLGADRALCTGLAQELRWENAFLARPLRFLFLYFFFSASSSWSPAYSTALFASLTTSPRPKNSCVTPS